MPSLGADMDSGTVVEWRVAPGDHVQRGDIVAVVDTDKSTVDVEVFESGVVQELLVPVGVEVEVGTPLAVIGPGPTGALTPVGPSTAATPGGAEAPDADARRVEHAHVTSPLVRHLAERLGVDTDAVDPSGRGSVVTRADVEAAAGARAQVRASGPAPAERARGGPSSACRAASPRRRSPVDAADEAGVDLRTLHGSGPGGAIVARDVPATPPRRDRGPGSLKASVAALMARSKREVPHYYLRTTVELGAVRAMARRRERGPTAGRAGRARRGAVLGRGAGGGGQPRPQRPLDRRRLPARPGGPARCRRQPAGRWAPRPGHPRCGRTSTPRS